MNMNRLPTGIAINRILCGMGDTLVFDDNPKYIYVLYKGTFHGFQLIRGCYVERSFTIKLENAVRSLNSRMCWNVITTDIIPERHDP